MQDTLPIIDLGSSGEGDGALPTRIAAEVGAACRDVGFFYVVNHGVAPELIVKAFASRATSLRCLSPTSGSLRSRQLAATEAIPGSFTRRSTRPEGRT
jgi:non-haem dioxygenase in morphine synthesis N-terminal